jgi:ABC-type branched-subunit amino acid transport system substrate-binding protein
VQRTAVAGILSAAVAASAMGLSACGDEEEGGGTGTDGQQQAALDLTIGDLVPLTGALSDFGPPGRKASDLAVEQIRQAAEEIGAEHTVRVVHEDTQTEPQASVQAARKVIADGASCLTGAWASADTIPVARSVAMREDVPQISPASTSDQITELQDDGLISRTVPPDSFQGPALAAAIEQALGSAEGKVVNIGARNDAYGTGLADTFSAEWEKRGGEIGRRVIYDPNQPSYNSEAAQIASGNPDAYVIVDFPETYSKVGPALVRAGRWNASDTWVTDGLKSSSLPNDAGEEATEGMRGTAPGVPDEDSAAQAFDRLWTQAGGPGRQTFDAQNFDAAMLCYLAAVAAGSTDGADIAEHVRAVSGPPGAKYTWEQLADAVAALQQGDDIDYDGASGPIDLNEAGDATAGVYDIFRFQGGELENFDEVPLPRLDG